MSKKTKYILCVFFIFVSGLLCHILTEESMLVCFTYIMVCILLYNDFMED